MAISDEQLGYEAHLDFYRGFLTGKAEHDAHWHREAEYLHALSVTDACLAAFQATIALLPSLKDEEADLQLRFGVARRIKLIWLSLRGLIATVPPNREEPLPRSDLDQVARDLNVIYINIRGTLDNLARCLIALFGNEASKAVQSQQIHLFSEVLHRDTGLAEPLKLLEPFRDWNNELKSRRDPAAHQIPLSVPPAILGPKAQAEYSRTMSEYQEALNSAFKSVGTDQQGTLFERADALSDELDRMGEFVPVFYHHPREGMIKIYPTVPGDIGYLVKITRLLDAFPAKEVSGMNGFSPARFLSSETSPPDRSRT